MIITGLVLFAFIVSGTCRNCTNKVKNFKTIASMGGLNDECARAIAYVVTHGCNQDAEDRLAAHMANYDSQDQTCEESEDTDHCVEEVDEQLFEFYSRVAESACRMVQTEFCRKEANAQTFKESSEVMCQRIKERAELASFSVGVVETPLKDIWDWVMALMLPHLLVYGGVFSFFLLLTPDGCLTRLVGVSLTVLSAAAEVVSKFTIHAGGGVIRISAVTLFAAFILVYCGVKIGNVAKENKKPD